MKNKLWNATGIFVQLVVMAIPILIVLALLMVATSSLPLAIVLAVCIHLHMPELGGGGETWLVSKRYSQLLEDLE